MRILTIIAGVIVLFVVIVIYLAVSYKRANATNMPKGCTGDCATCRLHADSAKALANSVTGSASVEGAKTEDSEDQICDGRFVKDKK